MHLRIDARLLCRGERLFDEVEDSEDLSGANIHCEVAAPGATRSTGQRTGIRGRADPSAMALLRSLERAKHSQVADLVTRQRVFLREYVANKGNIEGELHGQS